MDEWLVAEPSCHAVKAVRGCGLMSTRSEPKHIFLFLVVDIESEACLLIMSSR